MNVVFNILGGKIPSIGESFVLNKCSLQIRLNSIDIKTISKILIPRFCY